MHVLVVDDDAAFCTLARRKMAKTTACVVEAFDGLSAWQLSLTQSFDLALVDLGLPGLDGLSLISRMRNHPKTQHLPIIVITGRDDREAIDAAFAAGATFFLTKPINWALFGHQLSCVMRLAASERDARQARQRALAESRIKDTIISRLSYNLRPLARELAESATAVAALSTSRAPADRIGACAATMLADAQRLDGDLVSMIDFATSVSRHLELCERRISLCLLLTGVAEQVDAQARAHSVSVSLELPGAVDINADAEQLSIALLHLLENAVRFAPPGSEVKMGAHQPEDGSVYITVDDEGAGIDADLLAQLLSPFPEVGTDCAGAARLSGLGLAIAKLVAEGHGGALTVRSAPGRGTTASIHLPPERVLIHRSEGASGGRRGFGL